MSKGFQGAGFDAVLAIESWQAARETYAKNFDHPVSDMDLTRIRAAAALVRQHSPDIIVGGPPCQDFSAAGGRSEGARALLTEKFARIVRAASPTWFVMENVEGVAQSSAWAVGRDLLTKAGYGITDCLLNAEFYGVPQTRKRFFSIGCQGQKDDFLFQQLVDGASDDAMTVRDFVGDEFGIDYYYRHPRNWGRRGVFSIDEPSPTVRSTNRPVPPGYTRHPNDAAHFKGARPLSARERSRVQTFGKTYKFTGTMTDQDVMIANAVPVRLARYVAKTIMNFEEERLMLSDPGFRTWLTTSHDYGDRTAGNVVSRIKRATRILHTKVLPTDPLDAIQALERREEFVGLSSSVRSQIKKAIRLHAQFHTRR